MPGSTGSSAAWRTRSSTTTWWRSSSPRTCGCSARRTSTTFPTRSPKWRLPILRTHRPMAGLLGHLHADRTHDALARLGSISAPTLITAGEMDCQIPTRYGSEVQWWMPGSRMHVFEGPFSSHCAFIEMADEFNEISLGFLAEHCSETGGGRDVAVPRAQRRRAAVLRGARLRAVRPPRPRAGRSPPASGIARSPTWPPTTASSRSIFAEPATRARRQTATRSAPTPRTSATSSPHSTCEDVTLVGWAMAVSVAVHLLADGCDRVGRLVWVDHSPRFFATPDWSLGLFGDLTAGRVRRRPRRPAPRPDQRDAFAARRDDVRDTALRGRTRLDDGRAAEDADRGRRGDALGRRLHRPAPAPPLAAAARARRERRPERRPPGGGELDRRRASECALARARRRPGTRPSGTTRPGSTPRCATSCATGARRHNRDENEPRKADGLTKAACPSGRWCSGSRPRTSPGRPPPPAPSSWSWTRSTRASESTRSGSCSSRPEARD